MQRSRRIPVPRSEHALAKLEVAANQVETQDVARTFRQSQYPNLAIQGFQWVTHDQGLAPHQLDGSVHHLSHRLGAEEFAGDRFVDDVVTTFGKPAVRYSMLRAANALVRMSA